MTRDGRQICRTFAIAALRLGAVLVAALAVAGEAQADGRRPMTAKPHYRPFNAGLRCQTATQICALASARAVGLQCTCDFASGKRGYGRVVR